MKTVDIGLKDYPNWKAKVDAVAGGAIYPLSISFSHEFKPGIVVPAIGIYEIFGKDEKHQLVLQSYQQVWDFVSHMAHLASLYKREKIATLYLGEVDVKEPDADEAQASSESQSGEALTSVQAALASTQAAKKADARNKE